MEERCGSRLRSVGPTAGSDLFVWVPRKVVQRPLDVKGKIEKRCIAAPGDASTPRLRVLASTALLGS